MKTFIIFCLALLITVKSTNFDIRSVSNCTFQNSNGFCTRWEQNGTVQEQLGSCFSENMRVISTSGFKYFNQIEVGDKILGLVDGVETFTSVTGWFHYNSTSTIPYLNLYTGIGNIFVTVSGKHNVAH